MDTFNLRTRKWLLSLIRQRKQIIRLNRSLKPQHIVEETIKSLELQLASYMFTDLAMARFILGHTDLVEIIMPGRSSAAYSSKERQLNDILNEARDITKTETNQTKAIQYELQF